MSPKVAILAGIGLFASVLLVATQARACDYTVEEVVANFAAANHPVTMLDAATIPKAVDDIKVKTGTTFEGVTRAFVVNTGQQVLLGLEVGGCLLPPIPLTDAPAVHA